MKSWYRFTFCGSIHSAMTICILPRYLGTVFETFPSFHPHFSVLSGHLKANRFISAITKLHLSSLSQAICVFGSSCSYAIAHFSPIQSAEVASWVFLNNNDCRYQAFQNVRIPKITNSILLSAMTDWCSVKTPRYRSVCVHSKFHMYRICYFCSSPLYSCPWPFQHQMLQRYTTTTLMADQDLYHLHWLGAVFNMLWSVLLSVGTCMSCRMDGFVQFGIFPSISFPSQGVLGTKHSNYKTISG